MSIDPSIPEADKFQGSGAGVLSCTNCHTDRHLLIESIHPPDSNTAGLVSIEYSCGRCEAFFAHDSSVESVAKLLARSPCDTGVLKFGRYYIHCGEPMIRGRVKLARLNVSSGGLAKLPAVEVPIAVLRCHCGFQISIPR